MVMNVTGFSRLNLESLPPSINNCSLCQFCHRNRCSRLDPKKTKAKWEKEWEEVRVRTGLMRKVAEFLRSKRAKELALTSNRAVVEYCL